MHNWAEHHPTVSMPVWLRVVLFCAAYFIFAHVGSFFSLQPESFVSFWLPSGLFVATLLINERRYWPWFVLAAFPANIAFDLLNGRSLPVSLIFCCGNSLEAFVGAWLVRRFVAERPTLSTTSQVIGLAVYSAILSTAVGATGGAAVVSFLLGSHTPYWETWFLWWSGDGLAVVLLVPLILTGKFSFRWPLRSILSARNLEFVISLMVGSFLIFWIFEIMWHLNYPMKYLVFPFSFWFAARFGLRGIVIFNAATAMIVAWLAVSCHYGHYHLTAFAGRMHYPDLLEFAGWQAYLAIVSLVGLFLAAVFAERHEVERQAQVNITRGILEDTLAGYWDWDIVNNAEYLSPTLKKMFGYEDHELPNTPATLRKLIFPEDFAAMSEVFRRHVESRGKVPYYNEIRCRHKDGSTVWAISAGRVVEWNDKWEPLRMVGCHVNITERKQMEMSLRESEEKFRLVADFTYDWEYWLDETDRFIYVSPACERITGYTADEFMQDGGLLERIIHSEDMAKVAHHLQEEFPLKQSCQLDFRVVRKDGAVRWIGHVCQPVFGRDGRFMGRRASNRDITERRLAEEALGKEKYVLEKTINSLPGIFYLFDAQGEMKLWNRNLEIVLGYSFEEIAAINPLDVFEEDKAIVSKAIQEVFTKGTSSVEAKMVSRDGKRTDFFLSGFLLHLDGMPHLVGAGIDISERKKAEEARHQIAQLNKQIIESAQEGVVVYDRNLRYLIWNPYMEKFSGIKAAELIGRHPLEFFPFLKDVGVMERLEKALSGEYPPTVDFPFNLPNGKTGWSTDSSAPLKDAEGRIIGVIATVRDITERKLAENELRESEEKFRLVADFTHDWEYWLDENYHLVYVSPACERLTGYSVDEFIQDYSLLAKIVHAEDKTTVMSHLYQDFKQKQSCQFDFRLIRKDEELRWMSHACQPVFSRDGRFMGRRGSNRDITERKLAEETAIKAKEQAEAASRVKSEFLTTISHDLRTPLTSIVGFSSMLEEARLDEQSGKYVKIIQDKAQTLLFLTAELLEASRIKSGKLQLRSVEFDLNQLILGAVEVARLELRDKDIKISLLNNRPNQKLKGDSVKVDQIITNILSNAIKYTLGGEIVVTVDCSVAGERQDRCLVRVSVRDTGVGIEKGDLEHIFEPFSRFYEFDDRKRIDGIGLGLYIAKTMVNLSGGEISVTSEVGKGSIFTFTLDMERVL